PNSFATCSALPVKGSITLTSSAPCTFVARFSACQYPNLPNPSTAHLIVSFILCPPNKALTFSLVFFLLYFLYILMTLLHNHKGYVTADLALLLVKPNLDNFALLAF